jgi:hypothetical protein
VTAPRNNVLEGSASAAPTRGATPRAVPWAALWREISLNDALTSLYLCGLVFALLLAEPSAARSSNLVRFVTLLLSYCTITVWVRRQTLGPPWLRALAYRTAQICALLGSYLLFRDFLPVANPGSLDLQLYEFDLRWFGVEPALYLDSHLSPAATEWFAFFYYSYFFLTWGHLFPILYFSRDPLKVAFMGFGMTLVAAVGQTLYIVVPGFGPYRALADSFQNALPDGFWWQMVQKTVAAGGAQKDIFPSLHTGFPTFVALFSFHFRKELPFRYTWPLVTFFVLNIIGATLYLRWHYLIDVVAGFVLAVSAYFATRTFVPREVERRRRYGAAPVWPPWRASSSQFSPHGDRVP